jgi:bacterioferritin
MKGNPKIIAALNNALAEELTATSQYMVHSEMYDNWGYAKLHKGFEKVAIDEMKHAEKLIARILFLEGRPVVSELKKFHIGATPEKMIANDLAIEIGAVKLYNEIVTLAAELGDHGTRDFVQAILNDEERHVDVEEMLLDQISQMGIQTFLAEQTKE